ncbi:hypothetical protein LTR82_008257 [Friedmanniomyces endolithicus]|uniref:Uncharacterized protein n=1 Tax=Friedmanniomyces endolithicus TaxID=329885 RepID=A0AAN6FLD2_9PEZI|nr:hypothetical protein LTR82_008257 [Friedmanniomyces endolithicus]
MPEHLLFSTGEKVVDQVDSAQPTHLLAMDDFGVLVQEAYGRKRTRISVSDECGIAMGRTEDSDSAVKRLKLSKDRTGSTNVAIHRPADQDESQIRIRHFETASYADTTNEEQQQEESSAEYVAARVKEVGRPEEEDSDQADDRDEVIAEIEDRNEVNEVEEVAEVEVGDRDETEETEEAGEVIDVEVDTRNRVEGVNDVDDVDDVDEADDNDEEEGEEEEEKRGEDVAGIAAEWKRRSLNVQQQAQQKAKKMKKKRAETAHTARRRVKHAVSKGNINLPTDTDEEAEAPREPLCFPSSKLTRVVLTSEWAV